MTDERLTRLDMVGLNIASMMVAQTFSSLWRQTQEKSGRECQQYEPSADERVLYNILNSVSRIMNVGKYQGTVSISMSRTS